MNDNSHNGGYVPVFRMAMLHPRWLGTWLILGIVRLLVYLPRSFASLAGAGIGDLFYRLNKKRRRVTQANLRLCFPEMPDDERYRLMRRHYRVYGQTFVDMGLIWWASERFIDRYVRFRGLDYYRQVRESGKQVILLTGHFVAIDIGGPVISRHYKQIGLINTIDNEVLDWILGRGRVRFGSRMLLRDRGMRQVVQHIRDGFGFSYVPDEDFGPEKSVFVPFLGTEAPTLTSVGKLARMSNAAVLARLPTKIPQMIQSLSPVI
jgi:lauroyl/myristoyl acyltransferase